MEIHQAEAEHQQRIRRCRAGEAYKKKGQAMMPVAERHLCASCSPCIPFCPCSCSPLLSHKLPAGTAAPAHPSRAGAASTHQQRAFIAARSALRAADVVSTRTGAQKEPRSTPAPPPPEHRRSLPSATPAPSPGKRWRRPGTAQRSTERGRGRAGPGRAGPRRVESSLSNRDGGGRDGGLAGGARPGPAQDVPAAVVPAGCGVPAELLQRHGERSWAAPSPSGAGVAFLTGGIRGGTACWGGGLRACELVGNRGAPR